MEISTYIQKLNSIVEDLESKLITYSQKENANKKYLEIQFQLVENLREIADKLNYLEPVDLWLTLLNYFKRYQSSEKDGYIIYLPLKRNPKVEKFIKIDLRNSEGVRDE